ncbi:hypothetical protein BJX68DRAFT_271922 [Aspergillus pseudodeflectus]|uniref:Uncharacterized protein n=1 Tax=Aspergillus pseudodeflectus TaxID=176178 RepID=A0ABR4JIL7_9EURO
MVSSRTTCNTSTLLFRISDARTQKVVGIEVAILIAFFMYTAILYRLSTIWDRQSLPSETKSTSNNSPKDEHADFTKDIAVDVWFGLALIPTFDAIAIVGTCNLAIINRWHYFVSIRMMVLAYLASIIVILSSKPGTTKFIYEHPGSVFMLAVAVYAGIGACFDYFRTPPPKTSMNLREWTMSEYVGAIGRSHVEWWGIIPLVSTAFEAIILRKTRFRRTCQYTVLSAPFFQGGVCVHWGLKQIIGSPRLFLRPWMFLLLLVTSRLILDLHLRTLFRNCPEFQWARTRAVLPTTQLVPVVLILLFLEMMQLSVVKWVKPVSVFGIYLAGIVAGTLPGAYTLVFGRENK